MILQACALFHTRYYFLRSFATFNCAFRVTHKRVHILLGGLCAGVCFEHLLEHDQPYILDEHQRRLFTERLYIQLTTTGVFLVLQHVSEE